MEARLEMRGIGKSFGATVALGQVDFTVRAGEVHALVGENGAGKSTLMKILSGALRADRGEMRLDGAPYEPRHPLEARRAGVGMIYQELSVAPHLSVEENIVLGMEPVGWGGRVRRGRMRAVAREALAQLGHADLDPGRPAGELSVSAQQLVEIARALATGCRVLVLDEPTSSLTQADVERLFAVITRLRGQGMSLVYISHFLEEVQRLADTVTVLRDGSVVGSRAAAETHPDELVQMMVGRDVRELYPRSRRVAGEVVLEVRGLAGEGKPLSASLELRRGEVLGICGLVGAGRTELFRALFGLAPIRRGEVKLGAFCGAANPRRRWAQGAGMLSENRKEEGLALGMSIADNVTLTRLGAFGRWGFVSPSRQEAAAAGWIESLGIRCRDAAQPIGDLSGGNQQKGALARLLQHDVDVLLLDEPTRGIDVAAKARIYRVIDELVSRPENPKAVLMISSYLPELMGVCDRIAVMCRGKLSPARPAPDVTEHDLMLVATGKEEWK